MSTDKYQLFFIEWYDAVTDNGWVHPKEDLVLHKCLSVGWLIKETKHEIVLAADTSDPEYGVEDTEVNRRIAIPKSWIVLRRKLKLPKA